ncbi:MAG: hypothetical protein R6X06_06470, partial [Gammaproteobacteria bacterium]
MTAVANLNLHRLRKPLLHLAVLVGLLYLYARMMEAAGGFSTEFLHRQLLELGLVLYLYGLLYFSLKPMRGRMLLAALPGFLLYVVHHVFYLVYGKVFRFINLSEVPELLQLLPLGYSLLLLLVFVVPLLLLLRGFNYRRPLPLLGGLAPLVLLAVAIETT